MSYSQYLELPKLLGLQHPVAQPAVHDEMLFIVVHQAHELWFKQILFELFALIEQIDRARWQPACRTLDRLSAIITLLIHHVEVLEMMPPTEFQRFRAVLGSATGMQSEQFRRIEELSGHDSAVATPPTMAAAPTMTAAPTMASAPTIASSSTVRQAYLRAVGCTEARRLGQLLREPDRVLEKSVADRLLNFDEQMARWRGRHMVLVQKMIGSTVGTGGSAGVRYLQGTLRKRFFPELWAACNGEPDA